MSNRERGDSNICPQCHGRGRILRDDCIIVTYKQCEKCWGTGRFELQTGRIDIVKRHASTGRVMRLLLEHDGYEVRVFTNPESYVDQLKWLPDCILAGYVFEHGLVHSLFARLASCGIDRPVIVCTNMDITLNDLPSGTYALFADHSNRVSDEMRETIKRAVRCRARSAT